MSEFQIMYLCFGGFQIAAGITMIITYSVSYPWWKDSVGRMMIAYAAAELGFALLLMVTILFELHPAWFRTLWFALQTIVGCVFIYQTGTIVKLRRERAARRRRRQNA